MFNLNENRRHNISQENSRVQNNRSPDSIKSGVSRHSSGYSSTSIERCKDFPVSSIDVHHLEQSPEFKPI